MSKSTSSLEHFAVETSAALYVTDSGGRCTHLNRRYSQLVGLPRKRLLGMGWLDSVHPDDRERLLARRRGALGIEAFEVRYRILREGTKPVWVRANSVALFDAKGTFVGRIGSVTEMRALNTRRAADLALQASLTRQEARVLGLLADGKTNPEIAATLGLSRHTVKNYLSHTFEKLGVKRRSQAATLYVRLREAKPSG